MNDDEDMQDEEEVVQTSVVQIQPKPISSIGDTKNHKCIPKKSEFTGSYIQKKISKALKTMIESKPTNPCDIFKAKEYLEQFYMIENMRDEFL